jgi:hypothetical protein
MCTPRWANGFAAGNEEQLGLATPGAVPQLSVRPRELSKAIDLVAQLAEHAGRMSAQGTNEQAMSDALGAAFAYMVAFADHLLANPDRPDAALAKAAEGCAEMTSSDLQVLRAFSTSLGALRTA